MHAMLAKSLLIALFALSVSASFEPSNQGSRYHRAPVGVARRGGGSVLPPYARQARSVELPDSQASAEHVEREVTDLPVEDEDEDGVTFDTPAFNEAELEPELEKRAKAPPKPKTTKASKPKTTAKPKPTSKPKPKPKPDSN